MTPTDYMTKILAADEDVVQAIDSQLVQNQVKELRKLYTEKTGEAL